MDHVNWRKAYDKIWNAIRADYQVHKLQDSDPVLERQRIALRDLVNRMWYVDARCRVEFYPQTGPADDTVLTVSILQQHADHVWWDGQPMIHHFTGEQLHTLAEIRDLVALWAQDRLPSLPANGDWPTVFVKWAATQHRNTGPLDGTPA